MRKGDENPRLSNLFYNLAVDGKKLKGEMPCLQLSCNKATDYQGADPEAGASEIHV